MSEQHEAIKRDLKILVATIEYMEAGVKEKWPEVQGMEDHIASLRGQAITIMTDLLRSIADHLAPGAEDLLNHVLTSDHGEQVRVLNDLLSCTPHN